MKIIILLFFIILINSRRIPNFFTQGNRCDSKISSLYHGDKKIDLKDISLKHANAIIGSTFGLNQKNTEIPIVDIFSSPRANLLIAIENLGNNQNKENTIILNENKNKKCESTSYISTFTTLITGVDQKKHMIFGKKWPIDNEKIEIAYENENSLPNKPTLQQQFRNKFPEGLIVSSSLDPIMLKAGSSLQKGDKNSILKNLREISKNEIKEFFTKKYQSTEMKVKIDNEERTLTFEKNEELFREIYGLNHLIEKNEKVQFYTFVSQSLNKYDQKSKEYQMAIKLLDETIKEVMREFNKKFENRVLTEIVLLGKNRENKITNSLKTITGHKLLNEKESFLPNIYLRDDVHDEIKLCFEIKEIIPSTVCEEKHMMRKILSINGVLQNNLVPNLTSSTYQLADTLDVADQQVFIWSIFLLIACVILTLVFVDSIEYENDPLFLLTN